MVVICQIIALFLHLCVFHLPLLLAGTGDLVVMEAHLLLNTELLACRGKMMDSASSLSLLGTAPWGQVNTRSEEVEKIPALKQQWNY